MKTVLYLQYFEPAAFPPLERSAWQFLKLGWHVHFVGVSHKDSQSKFELRPHPNLTCEMVEHSPGSRWSARRFFAAALRSIWRLRPDIVYCSQERAYPIGLLASFLPGVKTVLHEHDSPWIGSNRGSFLLRWIRQAFARRASGVVIPQKERASSFSRQTAAHDILVVHNYPSLEEVANLSDEVSSNGLVIWHHGSIGPGRVTMSLIEALALLPKEVRFQLAGYETVGTRGYVQALKDKAIELGVADQFEYLGPVETREELFAAARGAQVGVCLFTTVFAEPMAGASNKPYDFLACGLPLIINDSQEWSDLFGPYNVSFSCNPESATDIARAIRQYLEHPEMREEMAARGYRLICDEWNYEAGFAPVLSQLGVTAPATQIAA